jgi:hypothetical protein
MSDLQVVRMTEDLNECAGRMQMEFFQEHFEFCLSMYANIIESYSHLPMERREPSGVEDAWKNFVIDVAPIVRELCEHSAECDDQLEESGQLDLVGSHSLILAELYDRHPAIFPDIARREGLTISRTARQMDIEIRPRVPEISFFSGGQLRLDLDHSLDETKRHLRDLQEHGNTDWLDVGLGVVQMAGGLVAKAGGALACASGAGCVVGGVAIVTGTSNIISGARLIARGVAAP